MFLFRLCYFKKIFIRYLDDQVTLTYFILVNVFILYLLYCVVGFLQKDHVYVKRVRGLIPKQSNSLASTMENGGRYRIKNLKL